jgi:hypothetical protein
VIDAIAQNPTDVGDLVVLRNLCMAVDAADKLAVSRLTRDFARLSGVLKPLKFISYELFHALTARTREWLRIGRASSRL